MSTVAEIILFVLSVVAQKSDVSCGCMNCTITLLHLLVYQVILDTMDISVKWPKETANYKVTISVTFSLFLAYNLQNWHVFTLVILANCQKVAPRSMSGHQNLVRFSSGSDDIVVDQDEQPRSQFALHKYSVL